MIIKAAAEPTDQSGWRIVDWCRLTGISPQMTYLFWRQGTGPHRVKLGRRLTIVTESPDAYIKRMAEPPTPARPAKAPTPLKPAQAANPCSSRKTAATDRHKQASAGMSGTKFSERRERQKKLDALRRKPSEDRLVSQHCETDAAKAKDQAAAAAESSRQAARRYP